MTWLLLLGLSGPVQAAEVIKDPPKLSKVVLHRAVSVQDLEAWFTEAGWAYQTSRTTGRDSFLRVELNGYKVVVVLSDKGVGRASDLHLYAGFQTPETPTPTVINQWNTTRRFCRAYVDGSGDPVLEADVDLEGGVHKAHVLRQLEMYGANVAAFADHIGFRAP